MTVPDELPAGPLVLRRWRVEMLDELMAAIEESFDALRPWMPWAAAMPTDDEERGFLLMAPERFEAGTEFGYGMHQAESGRFVGGCGLHAHHGPALLEIGYWVRTTATGRGYATAAARALTAAGFADVPTAARIQIRCGVGNAASAAIPPKLGYVLDRIEKEHMVWARTRFGI